MQLNFFYSLTDDNDFTEAEFEFLKKRKEEKNGCFLPTVQQIDQLNHLNDQLERLESAIRVQLDAMAVYFRSRSESTLISYQLAAQTELQLFSSHTIKGIRMRSDYLLTTCSVTGVVPLYPVYDLYTTEGKRTIQVLAGFTPCNLFTALVWDTWLCWEDLLNLENVNGVTTITWRQFLSVKEKPLN